MLWHVVRRLLMLIPQLLLISVVTFTLVRLLPGNPARQMLGPLASEHAIAELSSRMGLDKPLHIQYLLYLRDVIRGDLGVSWYTTEPVARDLVKRAPATFELITFGLVAAAVIGVSAGTIMAVRPHGWVDRVTRVYTLMAGALPDFWLGLLLIYFLFFRARLALAPMGRLDIGIAPPTRLTGMYVVDSLITLNWQTLANSVAHLVLPVLTLAIVNAAPIMKMTRTTMNDVMNGDFIRHARASGLHQTTILRYALKNAFLPILTLSALIYTYLVGGAVLVETIFAWGGIGQYAVQALQTADYAAIQGFVLVTATFVLVVNLVVDVVYGIVDPRVKF
jgi:ABC-type dipeptide/oligopeptide/nickel transport system permease component